MKMRKIIILIAALPSIYGCEKAPTPVANTPAPSNKSSPLPSVRVRSPADEEALRQVKARFARHYRQQGDLWTTEGFDALWSTQVKQPSFTIASSALSDIDKLNGYEYRGRAIIKFAASRDSHFELGRDNTGQWDDWKAGGQETVEVFKQKGAWRFRITVDPYGNQKDW